MMSENPSWSIAVLGWWLFCKPNEEGGQVNQEQVSKAKLQNPYVGTWIGIQKKQSSQQLPLEPTMQGFATVNLLTRVRP